MKHILYFTADWCNPCKKTRPIVEELNREQIMAKFFIIDVDAEIEMAQDFEVRSIPTFVLIKDNVEIYRVTGAQTRQQLEELIAYEKDIQNDI
jgi:thioredoxin 1